MSEEYTFRHLKKADILELLIKELNSGEPLRHDVIETRAKNRKLEKKIELLEKQISDLQAVADGCIKGGNNE